MNWEQNIVHGHGKDNMKRDVTVLASEFSRGL